MAISEDWVADLLKGYTQITQDGTPVFPRKTLDLIGASVEDDPNYVDPSTGAIVGRTRLTVNTGDGQPFLLAALRTTLPVGPRAAQAIDGHSAQGDGGEGLFVWSNTDTRADNGGTILQVTGAITGRWNRVFTGQLSVRWFGAKGDGVSDDTAAIQATYDAQTALLVVGPDLGPALGNGPRVYFPAGKYKLTTEVDINNNCTTVADRGACVFTSDSTITLFRCTGIFNNFEGGLVLQGGAHHITFYGKALNAAHNGTQWGDPTLEYPNVLNDLDRRYSYGHSIYLDTTPTSSGGSYAPGRVESSAAFYVQGGYFFGPHDFFGTADVVVEKDITVFADFSAGVVPVATDSSTGAALGLVVSGDNWSGENYTIVPNSPVNSKAFCLFEGCGSFKFRNVRFGGESTIVPFRQRDTIHYAGLALPHVTPSVSSWYIDIPSLSCAGLQNWFEAYENFPYLIVLRLGDEVYPNGSLSQTHGLWVDSSSCPLSGFVDRNTQQCQILIEGVHDFDALRIRTSADPTITAGTDLVPALRRFINAYTPEETRAPRNNLCLSGFENLQNWSLNSNANISVSGPETGSGYSLHYLTATADGAFDQRQIGTAWGAGVAAGEYTFSLQAASSWGARLLLGYYNGTNFVYARYVQIEEGTSARRFGFSFWHDGATTKKFFAQFVNAPNAGTIRYGLPAVHAGASVAPYLHPVDNPAAPTTNITNETYISEVYYGTAAPTSGAYKLGDKMINTSIQPNGSAGAFGHWLCISSGSPGLWVGMDAIPYTPAQEANFLWWYDADDVAPGAITAWDSRGPATLGILTLTGTATAHASGGSGPNGLAYVSFNGTSDILHYDQSSLHTASEWFLVARYTAPGTSGTICDGGAGNDGRVYRSAATTVNFDHGTLETGTSPDLATWCIFHVICDGANVTVNINGATAIAGANVSNGMANGITLGNFGIGGDPAACQISDAVGYTGTLSAGARTRVINYLSSLAGLTGQT